MTVSIVKLLRNLLKFIPVLGLCFDQNGKLLSLFGEGGVMCDCDDEAGIFRTAPTSFWWNTSLEKVSFPPMVWSRFAHDPGSYAIANHMGLFWELVC
eukprot:766134-Amphidinium_carterae.2